MKRIGSLALALAAGGLLAQHAAGAPDTPGKGPLAKGNRTVVLPPAGGPDGPGFSDSFDSYPVGPLVPQNGWLYWAATGQVNANVDSSLAASPPNSVVAAVETDVVQVFNITSGRWQAKVKTYYPSSSTGTGYFIMLNTYANPYVSGGNWSIELQFNGTTNQLVNVRRAATATNTTLPLIKDQWVELVVDIDLTADRFTVTYGGQPLVQAPNNQWSFHASTPAGQPRIQCIDLYSQSAGFRWDDLSLQPVAAPCYANCDGSTIPPVLNVNDFICFQTKYAAGDPAANCDGSTLPPTLNVNDFICFQTQYAAGCP